MAMDLQNFTPAERATFTLRALYEQRGYRKYRCSRFEEYALYQEYNRFLPDTQVVTFTDLDGKLRAIKPDVTLSIAKTAQPAPGECKRFYYNEEVCRPSRESHTSQTIRQMGLECIGAVDAAAQSEVVGLAWQSFVTGLLDALAIEPTARGRLLEYLRGKNGHELRRAAEKAGLTPAAADSLCGLLALHGTPAEVLPRAEACCLCEAQRDALIELRQLLDTLPAQGCELRLQRTGVHRLCGGHPLRGAEGRALRLPDAALYPHRQRHRLCDVFGRAGASGGSPAPGAAKAAAEGLAEHRPAQGTFGRYNVQFAGQCGLQRQRGL